MNIIKLFKSFLPSNIKNYFKEKLNLNVIIWLPSKYILNQEITVSKYTKDFVFIANGVNPINDTLYEIFDYDCYFLDNYYNLFNQSLVFDIGANIGVYSVIASNFGAKVIAIEPDKANIEYLSKNMLLNNCNFEIINSLVYSKRGLINFNMLGSVSNSIIFEDDQNNTNKIESITISDIIGKVNSNEYKYKILKMDIEGAEYSIFENIDFDLYFFDIYVMEIHDINKSKNLNTFLTFFDNTFEIIIKKDFHNRNFLNTIIAIKKNLC